MKSEQTPVHIQYDKETDMIVVSNNSEMTNYDKLLDAKVMIREDCLSLPNIDGVISPNTIERSSIEL